MKRTGKITFLLRTSSLEPGEYFSETFEFGQISELVPAKMLGRIIFLKIIPTPYISSKSQ